MNLAQYHDDALRTESRPQNEKEMSELAGRIQVVAPCIVDVFKFMKTDGEYLDAIKKYLFYNHKTPELDEVFEAMGDNTPIDSAQMARFYANHRLLHALLGIGSEFAEMLEELLGHIMDGKEFDKKHFAEEIGDQAWYNNLAADAIGGRLKDILERNVAKLKIRFPSKFTNEAAATENRDLEAEKAVLYAEENCRGAY